jgi:hypothetical protein
VRGLNELNPTAHHSTDQMDRVTAVASGWQQSRESPHLVSEVAATVREHPDPYLVLGVSPTATQAEITHAYRTRLRTHHPDTRRTPSPPTADDHLLQVLAAYALLRDPARRADYDHATAHTAKPPHGTEGPAPADHPPAGGVQIPITYRTTNTPTTHIPAPPLRAGPVRRHR